MQRRQRRRRLVHVVVLHTDSDVLYCCAMQWAMHAGVHTVDADGGGVCDDATAVESPELVKLHCAAKAHLAAHDMLTCHGGCATCSGPAPTGR